MMKSVGIIGFGSFGKFLAEKLSSYAHVSVYSHRGIASSWAAELEQVVNSDYVILAIPLQHYESVVEKIRPYLLPGTVIVDVCSVKVKPITTLKRLLPQQPIVATHPMFGPQSASESLKGHTIIMCPESSAKRPYDEIRAFCQSVGLEVVQLSADEHDQEIAVVQGLTFFVARALSNMGLHSQQLYTPSFGRLLNLVELEEHHSKELFELIQNDNSHAAKVRERFVTKVDELVEELHGLSDSRK
jgi:prephenate dehydrogenase